MPPEQPSASSDVNGTRLSSLPDGLGVKLDPRPSPWGQVAFTIFVGLMISLGGAFNWWGRGTEKSFGGFALPTVIILAIYAIVWLGILGTRTLERRRLLKRFPGTLVFSFSRVGPVVTVLRELGVLGADADFNTGAIQAVADLRGLTLWQGNPPQMYANLPFRDASQGEVRYTAASNAALPANLSGESTPP